MPYDTGQGQPSQRAARGLLDEVLLATMGRNQTAADVLRQGGILNQPFDQIFPFTDPPAVMMPEPERQYGRPDPTFDWSLRGTDPRKGNYRITGTYKW